jgi:hypothetical protein
MIRAVGLALLLLGAYLAAQDQGWFPDAARLARVMTIPALPLSLTAIGIGGALVGLALVALPRRRAAELGDAPVRSALEGRGFVIIGDVGGWRAEGEWEGAAIVVRRVSGYEASRFGRPWVIEVSLRGLPREPWPLPPEEGKVVDVRDHGFSVTIPALSRPDGHARVDRLIAAVVSSAQR